MVHLIGKVLREVDTKRGRYPTVPVCFCDFNDATSLGVFAVRFILIHFTFDVGLLYQFYGD